MKFKSFYLTKNNKISSRRDSKGVK